MASSTTPMSNWPPIVLLTPISTLSKSMKTAIRVLRVSVWVIEGVLWCGVFEDRRIVQSLERSLILSAAQRAAVPVIIPGEGFAWDQHHAGANRFRRAGI